MTLRLYVHIPFCVRKCPYCDFNSHVRRRIDWARFTCALLAELEAQAERWALSGRRLASVFFGGGTPSLAPPELIRAVLIRAQALFPPVGTLEVTLEANPGASDAARFAAYREAGVNRLSIGVQSFSDARLQRLGRIHTACDAHRMRYG
ncbi:MAG: radical SAM protein, partial [Zetaproteobacteria bacterium]